MNTSADFKALNDALWAGGARFDGQRPIPVSLTPQWIAREEFDRLARDSQLVLEALELVTHLYCEDAATQSLYPELQDLAPWIAATVADQRRTRLARFDLVKDAHGEHRMVEANADCPGGIAVTGAVHRAFRDSAFYAPVANELLQRSEDPSTFVELMCSLAEAERPRLGFLWSQVSPIKNDLEALFECAQSSAQVSAAFLGELQRLRCQEQGPVRAADLPLDVAYLKVDTMLDSHGRAHWCAWRESPSEVVPFLKAITDGRLKCVNNLPSILVTENKRSLALLFVERYRGALSSAHRSAIDRLVVATSVVNDDSQDALWSSDEILKHQEDFVLKRPLDTRGRGVYIGAETPDTDWMRLVAEAKTGRLVAQKFVRPLREPLRVDIDRVEDMCTVDAFFLYAGQCQGVFGRSSAKTIINVGNGGVIRPTFIADERTQELAA